MSKKFFWLKLQTTFFETDDIKLLLSQKNGADYVIFWQKLLLKSISTAEPGVLRYKEKIPYTPEILSVVTDTNIDIVKTAMDKFAKLGLIQIKEDGEIWIEEATKLIGSESDSAERVRRFRERKKQKALHSNAGVTDSNKSVTQSKSKSKSKSKSIELEKEEEDNVCSNSLDNHIAKDSSNIKYIAPSCKNTSEPNNEKNSSPIITLQLNGQVKEFQITQKMIELWQEDYPNVNVLLEIKKMHAWLDANPQKRKTNRGIKRFIVSWLSRAQDNSGGSRQYQDRYSKNQEAVKGFLEIADKNEDV